MTTEDIIRMAREAGFERVVAIHSDGSKTVTVAPVPELEAFAALVAAAEREACAKVCEDASIPVAGEILTDGQWASKILAGKIRARGNT